MRWHIYILTRLKMAEGESSHMSKLLGVRIDQQPSAPVTLDSLSTRQCLLVFLLSKDTFSPNLKGT